MKNNANACSKQTDVQQWVATVRLYNALKCVRNCHCGISDRLELSKFDFLVATMSRPVSPHFCSLFTIWCVCFVSSVDSSNRKLIVVSFDAFKPVYFEQKITPFLQQFYTNGIRATRMNNSFPTKTFVNHFSIATGSINIFELFLKIKKNGFILRFWTILSSQFANKHVMTRTYKFQVR